MGDKSIDYALRTWYAKDHPLHFDLHHPLGKLVGEWGELLDDYMKHIYKPGYDWQPLDELVDIWYYIRILAYQAEIKLKSYQIDSSRIDYLISRAIDSINTHFRIFTITDLVGDGFGDDLQRNYSLLCKICKLSSLTIDQLTEASWKKLKPGSEHGEEWMRDR